MENSKICLGDSIVQPSPGQTMASKIIEEIVVKQERQEELAELVDEIKILKEETADFYGTEQYFNKPTFEIQESEYDSESNSGMKVEQNGCDSIYECMDIRISQNECRESPVHFKEENIDIKYEDLETKLCSQSTDWRNNVEKKEERSNKSKRTGNHGYKFSSVHKAKSKVHLHKCIKCSFETKYAGSLKEHMLVHAAKSEVDLYQCHHCSYAGKLPYYLTRYMFVHKAKSEVDLYKCQECSYSTKRSEHLKQHMLIHIEKWKVDLYRCQECLYATKRSHNLKQHMLVHKAKSDVELHKCDECSFTSKYARGLKKHMFVHKSKSEVDLYECHECSYAAKQAYHLKRHMLVHKAKSEVDLRKYIKHSFETKFAESLKKHMLKRCGSETGNFQITAKNQ